MLLDSKTKQENNITSVPCGLGNTQNNLQEGKTSMVNTNYNAQLFKTVSVQNILGCGYYKAGSDIILHFGITSAHTAENLQPELRLNTVSSLHAILCSAQTQQNLSKKKVS